MKAILLANMGAPVSERDMKIFLKRMFRDKAIIYAPGLVRCLVSAIVSNLRYKSSWKKYLQIGGSPLQLSMDQTAAALQATLPGDYTVRCVYSYSDPLLADEMATLYQSGVRDFTVISMYPQASFSTTGSLQADIEKGKRKFPELHCRFVESYCDNPLFIRFWTKQIADKIAETGYSKPYLLFSAHAIPQSFVERGDRYIEQINTSAQLIAGELNLPYAVSYQSKIGKMEWTKPDTKQYLKELHDQGVGQVVIVPISFLNENLETKYDLDTELIPFAQKETEIKEICRVVIPLSDELLVGMYRDIILKND